MSRRVFAQRDFSAPLPMEETVEQLEGADLEMGGPLSQAQNLVTSRRAGL